MAGNTIIVTFDDISKEVISCVSLNGGESICRKDVSFKIYYGTEPIFTENGDKILLNDEAFLWKNDNIEHTKEDYTALLKKYNRLLDTMMLMSKMIDFLYDKGKMEGDRDATSN